VSLAGVILAGGASRRMGSPKALLTLGSETFLERLARLFCQHLDPVLVVVGFHAGEIMAAARLPAGARFAVNPRHELGMLTSLQCGLRALPPDIEGVLFTPVDYPAVLPATVAALADALRRLEPGQVAVVPRFERRRGHPAGIARALIPEFLALPPDAQARSVMRAHAAKTVYLDRDDPGIVEDVDDPQAYARLRARLRI
jgi:molybdenum cofactor cytidylyltransferase